MTSQRQCYSVVCGQTQAQSVNVCVLLALSVSRAVAACTSDTPHTHTHRTLRPAWIFQECRLTNISRYCSRTCENCIKLRTALFAYSLDSGKHKIHL